MSLLDVIAAFSTGPITVSRVVGGAMVQGVWVPGAPTTFVVDASVQPATGMSRVVGGRDMESSADGQQTVDVRQLYCKVELKPRTPTTDPDIITFEGRAWTIFRVEEWTHRGTTFYRCVMTAETLGASSG